jgi:putative ABC transport system permease protein
MIGASMIVITRGMTDSFRIDLETWIDAYIGGDLFVSSPVPIRSNVWRRIENEPGVAAVSPIRYLEVTWDRPDEEDERLTYMAMDPRAHSQVTSFVFSDSQIDPQTAINRLLEGEAVFLSSVLSEKYGLGVGDSISLRTSTGLRSFEIAAVVVDFYNQGQVVQGSWQDMRRYFKASDANVVLVKVDPNQSVAEIQQRIENQYGKRDNLSVASNQSMIDRSIRLLQQSYGLFDALALIAMFVASLGVINTLTMSVIERTREIGMLRSIGLTRRQVLTMVLAEASVMGWIGGALGVVFGLVLTRIFLWSMTAMSGYRIEYALPITAIAIGLIIAILVSQLAAIIPARRAARLNILEAIQYD